MREKSRCHWRGWCVSTHVASEEWCVCVRVCIYFHMEGITRSLLSKTGREFWWPPILNIDFFGVETGGHKKCLVLHNVRL